MARTFHSHLLHPPPCQTRHQCSSSSHRREPYPLPYDVSLISLVVLFLRAAMILARSINARLKRHLHHGSSCATPSMTWQLRIMGTLMVCENSILEQHDTGFAETSVGCKGVSQSERALAYGDAEAVSDYREQSLVLTIIKVEPGRPRAQKAGASPNSYQHTRITTVFPGTTPESIYHAICECRTFCPRSGPRTDVLITIGNGADYIPSALAEWVQ